MNTEVKNLVLEKANQPKTMNQAQELSPNKQDKTQPYLHKHALEWQLNKAVMILLLQLTPS